MKVHSLLLLAYLVALVALAAAQGGNNGGNSGSYNLGDNNGGTNGNTNLGSGSGNNNGNQNTGNGNGNINGNQNTGNGNGNRNGNNNFGNYNGNQNGNNNLGSGNGNGNGNNNYGSGNGNGNGNNNYGSGNGNGNGNGNIGHGNGNGNGNGNAGGKGDPIMTGFGGRSFEFIGQPGTIYSIISEKFHKVSTKLKVGVMWDHNGTYMEGFGFQYRDHQITIEITQDDKIAVAMNGERLQMTRGETELELIPFVEGGELLLLWQLHRGGLGSAVEITTNLLQITIWLTPAGTVDEGGVKQPAYLNFDLALLGPPAANQMEGIIGETYNRMLAGEEALRDPESKYYLADDYHFHGKGSEADYALDSYFGETASSMFGKEHKRLLIENDIHATFPLHATGHGLLRPAAFVKAELHASGGRKGRFL